MTRKGGEGQALQRSVPFIYIDIQVLEWILVSIPTPTLRAGDGDLAIISTFQKSQTGSVPWVEPSLSAHCNQIDLSKSIFLGTCCLLKI